MENLKTQLSTYNNSWYNPGKNSFIRLLWFGTNALFFVNSLNGSSVLKVRLLRLFGAKIGKGVVIKPGVNIKYPWNLSIGDYSWIGERVWIDSLGIVKIGSNCCVSQGAMFINGNHDYSKPTFDLIIKDITLEDGVWIGAGAMVTGGVVCGSHAVLSVMSVASTNLESYGIYRGNPAVKVKNRRISE
jgi:putative colanic acid biosynthesis acetyltransferase WcaF